MIIQQISLLGLLVSNKPQPETVDFGRRLSDVENNLVELTDLSAEQYAELSNRCALEVDALRKNLEMIGKDYCNSEKDPDRLSDSSVPKSVTVPCEIDSHLKSTMMGVLQAAITPLAQHVADKLVRFERDLMEMKAIIEG